MGLVIGIGYRRARSRVISIPMTQTNLLGLGLSSANIDARLIFLSQIDPPITYTDIIINGNEAHGSSPEVLAAIDILHTNYNELVE